MEPPPRRFFKLNTDGAMRQPNTLASFGRVIQDDEGNWVKGYAGNIEATSVVYIEIMALLRGLQLALLHKLTPLKINIDCAEVISMLQSHTTIYSRIINDCRYLIHHLGDPSVIHTYREKNTVADQLAHFGMELMENNITFLE